VSPFHHIFPILIIGPSPPLFTTKKKQLIPVNGNMAGTRSSARLAGQPSSSPHQAESPSSSNGTKRKAESSSSASKPNKGRKTEGKEQRTLEETIGGITQDEEKDQPEDIEMKDAGSTGEGDKAQPDTKEQSSIEGKSL
jgi:hypothetical protein